MTYTNCSSTPLYCVESDFINGTVTKSKFSFNVSNETNAQRYQVTCIINQDPEVRRSARVRWIYTGNPYGMVLQVIVSLIH